MNGNTSLPAEILKCWNVGDDPSKAKYARFSGNDSDELNKNFRDNSDVFTQKADYLCIREISLQYALPQALLAKIGLKGLGIDPGRKQSALFYGSNRPFARSRCIKHLFRQFQYLSAYP